jgi:hypothetical protein
MKTATNTPYKRQTNEFGKTIFQTVKNDGSNRRNRRFDKTRLFNNKKHFSVVLHQLSPISILRFTKSFQWEIDKNGKSKLIEHLLIVNPK